LERQPSPPASHQAAGQPAWLETAPAPEPVEKAPGITAINEGEYNANDDMFASGLLAGSENPITIIFHLLFKGLTVFLYLFGLWLTKNYVITVVSVILSLSFDFWTVKNVSGRYLVDCCLI